jgi:branched-chain amino acid aminotransferase
VDITGYPVWIDGEVVDGSRALVHVLTPSLHYGWGAYEGVRFYDTGEGPAAFRLTAHLRRLRRSARALGLSLPYTDVELVSACADVVRASGLSAGYLRPLVFLGPGVMSVAGSLDRPRVAIGCWPWDAYLPPSGVRVRTSGWVRSGPHMLPPDVKSTGGYLNASLARLDAVRSGAHEAIMLNAAGRVAEASAANVFVAVDGTLATPPLSEGILPGITRECVLDIAESLDIPVVQRPIAPSELRTADEVILAGTAVELVSVSELDGVTLPGGPLHPRLRERFALALLGKLPNYEWWAERLSLAVVGG